MMRPNSAPIIHTVHTDRRRLNLNRIPIRQDAVNSLPVLPKQLKLSVDLDCILEATRVPPCVDRKEWLALCLMDHLEDLRSLCLFMVDICQCSRLRAGRSEFNWPSQHGYEQMSAPMYLQNLICWCETVLADERFFPTTRGSSFTFDFDHIVKTMYRRMSRVYCHLYIDHFRYLKHYRIETSANTCLVYFYLIGEEFSLQADPEMIPLTSLVQELLTNINCLTLLPINPNLDQHLT